MTTFSLFLAVSILTGWSSAQENRSPRQIRVWIDKLNAEDLREYHPAIEALAQNPGQSARLLTRHLGGQRDLGYPDEAACLRVTYVLGLLADHGVPSLEELGQLLEGGPTICRQQATWAIGSIAPFAQTPGDRRRAKYCAKLLRSEGLQTAETAFARARIELGTDVEERVLLADIGIPSHACVAAAHLIAHRGQGSDAIFDQLCATRIRFLNDPSTTAPKRRGALALSLAMLRLRPEDRRCLPALRSLLWYHDHRIRQRALLGITQHGAAAQGLGFVVRKMIGDGSEKVGVAAIVALAAIDGQSISHQRRLEQIAVEDSARGRAAFAALTRIRRSIGKPDRGRSIKPEPNSVVATGLLFVCSPN